MKYLLFIVLRLIDWLDVIFMRSITRRKMNLIDELPQPLTHHCVEHQLRVIWKHVHVIRPNWIDKNDEVNLHHWRWIIHRVIDDCASSSFRSTCGVSQIDKRYFYILIPQLCVTSKFYMNAFCKNSLSWLIKDSSNIIRRCRGACWYLNWN